MQEQHTTSAAAPAAGSPGSDVQSSESPVRVRQRPVGAPSQIIREVPVVQQGRPQLTVTNGGMGRSGTEPLSAHDENTAAPSVNTEGSGATPEAQKVPDERAAKRFAVLAKQRKALEAKQNEIAAQSKDLESWREAQSLAKASPLEAAARLGLTQDDIIAAIIAQTTQELKPDADPVMTEVETLKQRLDAKEAEEKERAEEQQRQQVEAQERQNLQLVDDFAKQAKEWIAQQGDAYELIVTRDASDDVVDLIAQHLAAQDGPIDQRTVMSLDEAAKLVEEELLREAEPFLKSKKLRSRIQEDEGRRTPSWSSRSAVERPALPVPQQTRVEKFRTETVRPSHSSETVLPTAPSLSNSASTAGRAGSPAPVVSGSESLKRAASLLRFT